MGSANIGIVPHPAIGIVEGQFVAKHSVGEGVDRYKVVDVRGLAVVGQRLAAERTHPILHRDQPGPFMREPEALRSESVRAPIPK